MIAYFVHCSGCGKSKQYHVDNPEKTTRYLQKDTHQWCPECRANEDKLATHKVLLAIFGEQEPEVSLW